MSLSPQDHEFARFIDALEQQLDAAAAQQLVALAYLVGRGSVFSEISLVPDPSTSADRHARYSAGIRQPKRSREADRQAQIKQRAALWGWQ